MIITLAEEDMDLLMFVGSIVVKGGKGGRSGANGAGGNAGKGG